MCKNAERSAGRGMKKEGKAITSHILRWSHSGKREGKAAREEE
jgi:hypothetical protein